MSEALNKAKSEVVRACKIISGNGYVLGTAGICLSSRRPAIRITLWKKRIWSWQTWTEIL